jgi:hypothetical protein
VDKDCSGRNREKKGEGIEEVEGYRMETGRWITIVREDQGEERVRNRRRGR